MQLSTLYMYFSDNELYFCVESIGRLDICVNRQLDLYNSGKVAIPLELLSKSGGWKWYLEMGIIKMQTW